MATREPGPLAGVVSETAAGARLVFVPSRVRAVGFAIGSSILVPVWIAAPLLLAFLFVILLTDSPAAWALLWIVVGLTVLAVAGLILGTAWLATAAVRWVEFRPREDPTQVAVAGFLRSERIPVADLERIVVVERFRLGERKSITVVLDRGRGWTTECEPVYPAPVSRVDTRVLLEWLNGRVGAGRTSVEYRKETDQNFSCPADWWTQADLAALWRVPAGAVDELAERHGVRVYRYTPRGAMTETVSVYHPGRAYEVAEGFWAERARRPETGDTQAAPAAE
ncbi:hypothetical protein [Streptomyces sp. NPDC008265]|uniref:hypothetical protein n=1 Tax=Streptomyces sp. NPDC008265 TaxID=3364824 RepID=UPI0036E2E358